MKSSSMPSCFLRQDELLEYGTPGDFIGHAEGENFVIITNPEVAQQITQTIKNRFTSEVQIHYNFMDRQQGFILAPDGNGKMEKVPLMMASVGMVSPQTHFFADIREITELAAEERRKDVNLAS